MFSQLPINMVCGDPRKLFLNNKLVTYNCAQQIERSISFLNL